MYDLLFKALMADKDKVNAGLKLRYGPALEKLSVAAEKLHHQYRRELSKHGCKVVSRKKQNGFYVVQCRVRGYIEEAIFSTEFLRAECEVRLLDIIGK